MLGVTFLFLYTYRAVDPYDYGIPYIQEEASEAYAYWEGVLEEKLELDTENGVPNFENSVIWVFNDQLPDGTKETVAWQYLYALPEGFGISCCMPDYIHEKFETLQSRYIATLSGGEIDEMCRDAGCSEIGRRGTLVIYRLHE